MAFGFWNKDKKATVELPTEGNRRMLNTLKIKRIDRVAEINARSNEIEIPNYPWLQIDEEKRSILMGDDYNARLAVVDEIVFVQWAKLRAVFREYTYKKPEDKKGDVDVWIERIEQRVFEMSEFIKSQNLKFDYAPQQFERDAQGEYIYVPEKIVDHEQSRLELVKYFFLESIGSEMDSMVQNIEKIALPKIEGKIVDDECVEYFVPQTIYSADAYRAMMRTNLHSMDLLEFPKYVDAKRFMADSSNAKDIKKLEELKSEIETRFLIGEQENKLDG